MPWRKPIKKIFKKVSNPFKKFSLYVKQKLGWLQKPIILPFYGFGNKDILLVRGRVMEDNGLAKAAGKNSILHNIWAMIKRFVSDEIPCVKVKATFKGIEKIAETGEDGMYAFKFDISHLNGNLNGWEEIEYELLDEVIEDQGTITAKGFVMFPPHNSKYGIISDIDDTFLVSHSTNSYKKLRLMLLKNARTRMPFKGVAAFYRALHCDEDKNSFNPIFYVSSSEWNLYDLLVDFIKSQKIPQGPFLLKNLKTSFFQLFTSGGGSHLHKLEKIRTIMHTFFDMNFILIGDSGQHDAEIYKTVTEEFPGRVLAIYIRDVRKSRHTAVSAIAAELAEKNIEMLLVKDTEEAAIHAIKKGYIDKKELPEIHEEKLQEEAAPADFQQILSSSSREE